MRALPRSCCLLLALASATAMAGPLYKWKDANGVTQYSERPPAGQKYEVRQIDGSDPVLPPAAETGAKPEPSSRCTSARSNLELLSGSAPVLQDTDGDGKPDTELDDGQRAAQKKLAEAAAEVYCK